MSKFNLKELDWYGLKELKDSIDKELKELSNREKVKVFIVWTDMWQDYYYDPINAYNGLKEFHDNDNREDWINSGEGTLIAIQSDYVEPAFAKNICKDEPITIEQ